MSKEFFLLKEIPVLDQILEVHADPVGSDFTAYRNHTYRVVNICVALFPVERAQLEKIAIAAAFHDIGIWTDGTFDYLQPSVNLACAHLIRTGQQEWSEEIAEMILQHHKISQYRGRVNWLVEPLRRADLVDVSQGLITFGLRRNLIREIYATWPSAGFHKKLIKLELTRLRTHPWNPLPMVRL